MRPLTKALLIATVVPLSAGARLGGPKTLAMSVNGVGPIHAATSADVPGFRKLFPGYEVTSAGDYFEDNQVGYVLVVRWQGAVVLEARTPLEKPKHILSVWVRSPTIAGPHGIHVGDGFAAVRKLGVPQCPMGSEQEAGLFFCSVGKEPFSYVLDGRKGVAVHADGNATLAGLAKLKISAIVWYAPQR